MAVYARPAPHGEPVRGLACRVLSSAMTRQLVAPPTEPGRTALDESPTVLDVGGLVDAGLVDAGHDVLARTGWDLLDSDVIRWKLANDKDNTVLEDLHELRATHQEMPSRRVAGPTRDAVQDLPAVWLDHRTTRREGDEK